ncbi:MAG: DUF2231 domain-containing protein [Gammaproteobacteria bacterium]|nr:hypothetical protein [Gammaproteobacteria bacterium]
MSTRASIAGHPIHPMLVTLPIGLWVFSLVCDFGYILTGEQSWATTAYFTLGGGIVGALLAAVPGLIDLLGLHDSRAQRVALYHMVLNLAIVVLQAINFWLRTGDEPLGALPRGISIVAVAALIASGWLGGHLVHVFGVTQPHGEPHPAAHRDRVQPRI